MSCAFSLSFPRRYRQACVAAWQAQDPAVKEFWRLFLRWGSYDFERLMPLWLDGLRRQA